MKSLIFIALFLFVAVGTALGVSGPNRNGDENEFRFEERREIRQDDDKVRIEIRQRQENENEVRIENRVEIQGNEFEITGRITAMGRDSITISGQQIFIDPELVGNFQERGVVAVGEMAKVEGVISDNKFFAREITVFNGQEVRIEIKGNLGEPQGTLRRLLNLINDLLIQIDSIRR